MKAIHSLKLQIVLNKIETVSHLARATRTTTYYIVLQAAAAAAAAAAASATLKRKTFMQYMMSVCLCIWSLRVEHSSLHTRRIWRRQE